MTKPNSHVVRAVVLVGVLALAAAACGDDGDAPATTADGGPASDDGVASPGPSEPATGSGDGGAMVTMATGEEFELDQELICIALGGAVGGTFTDGEGIELTIDIPPEDWETAATEWDPPSLTLRDESDDMNWRIFESGPAVAITYPDAGADEAVITDWSIDGTHVTGNGFMIDTFAISRSGADGSEPPRPVPVFFGFECS